MRLPAPAAALIALVVATAAGAFETEGHRRWGDGPGPVLRILSTTDIDIAAPAVAAFRAANPAIVVDYTMAASTEVYRAIADEGAAVDLVISSAMDLQMKLANDGFAAAHASAAAEALPDWARWRDRLFGFTLEPVVILAARAAFADLALPRARRALVDVLRDNPERFAGRIATYDPHVSGAGYLFATQDARHSDTFWRLAEVMGRLDAQLYCCSGEMIEDMLAGRIALAYNVVGSYAATRLAGHPDIAVIEPEDFTIAILRTALIPASAPAPSLGGAFLDFLLGPEGQALMADRAGLPPGAAFTAIVPAAHLRPVRLGPGLLVGLDPLERAAFLREWDAALIQP